MQQARILSTAKRPIPSVQPGKNPVAGPQPGHRLKKAKLVMILLTCFMLSLVVVAQYSSLVVLNYRLSSARNELLAANEITRTLELEAAKLGSIGRVEQIAREELGMVEPDTEQLVVIKTSRGE